MDDEVPLLPNSNGSVVSVEEVSYGRATKSAWRLELRDVSFVAQPGEVWACMGRAGPWMSSLLELLAVQRTEGAMSGRITFDGALATSKTRHVATLVSRESHLGCVSSLTVREILWASAWLRHGKAEKIVDETIELLGLTKCADVRIGDSLVRGISGGERRRLAIGLGLVGRPRVVLLNEPTTGLDSATALDVMRHVHDTVAVAQGRAVVAGLHTPSAEVFEQCDKLLLMATDGSVAYAGPARAALAFVRSVVPALVDDHAKNPADALLSLAAREHASALLVAGFARPEITSFPKSSIPAKTTPPLARQVTVLLWRSTTQFVRAKAVWKTSLLKMGWIAFLYASTFWNQPLTSTGAANVESCFYFALMFGILGNLRGIVTLFDERALFEHERSNGAYSAFAYWLATSVSQVPWLCFVNLVFSTVVFFSIGGAKVPGYGWVLAWYLLVTQLTNLVGFAWAQMLGAWTSSASVAMSVWQPGVYIWSQTSGYPIRIDALAKPNPAYWLMDVSFTRWAYEAIIVGFFHRGWGELARRDILDDFGYPTTASLWRLVLPLVVFIVLVRAVTYFPLREKKSKLKTKTYLSPTAQYHEVRGKDDKSPQAVVSTHLEEVLVDVDPVWYSVRVPNGSVKPILRGIGATVAPGELLAVLGPSGAGKSTFLDLVAGRKTTGFGAGGALYNGAKPTRSQRHKLQCYVMQHDVLIPNLTVGETVRIASMLRLDRPTDDHVRVRARQVMTLLGIDGCQSSLVKALADGQRRLCAAAVEMVHLPSVLYLDEPTSGLDSAMSLDFVKAMLRLADRRASVLCTIHQPSETIFDLFPKVLVIADGRAAFKGTPTEAAAEMRVSETPSRTPAEWLLDVIAKQPSKCKIDDGLTAPVADGFDLDAASVVFCSSCDDRESPITSLRRNAYHFRVHFLRNLLVLSHSRRAVLVAWIRNLCVALWYGVVYFDQTDMHSLASVTYFSQQFITMSNLQAIPQLFAERALFYREIAAGFYSPLPYLAARCALNAVVQIPLVLTYCVVVYPMVNLRGGLASMHFLFFFAVMFGLSLAGYAFSNLIAAITPNQQSALNLYSALFQFCMFYCGYAIPLDDVPWYWSWAPDFSFARWSFEALIINEFHGIDDDDGAGATYWLKHWNFYNHTKWPVFTIFVLQVAVFHLLALLAMRFVSFERT